MTRRIPIETLSATEFAPFGDVIESDGRESRSINGGMADRFHALARVDSGAGPEAAVISLVESKKFTLPRRVDHLECHPHGSQAFIPLDRDPFIVVVAAAAPQPDTTRLRAFVTNGRQGINYRAGTWHHVLLTPFAAMRFVCIDRDAPQDNCMDFHIAQAEQPLLEMP